MDGLALFWHMAGFAVPALVMPLPVVALGRALGRASGAARTPRWWQSFAGQWVINALACLAVLLLGLALTGHDGRMGTYVALTLVSASVQWLCLPRQPPKAQEHQN